MSENQLTEAIGEFVDERDSDPWQDRARRVIAAAEYNNTTSQLKEFLSWFTINDDDEIGVA